ncbi:MAG: sialate O-acetylesterase [Luteolibacter sp.]
MKSLLLIVLAVALQQLSAAIQLAPLFRDGAVLQRDMPVPVWGRAEPSTSVMVKFGNQSHSTTSDASGRWMVELEPMHARSVGSNLVVSNSGISIEVKDVLVGEVWLASGQSNMQWTVAQSRAEDQKIAKSAAVPLLRSFDVPRVLSHDRLENVDGSWRSATPENVGSFSAVGYFFARRLVEELDVPVGLIHSSWGGSRIEPWWAEEGLLEVPELREIAMDRRLKSPGFPKYQVAFSDYLGKVRNWVDACETAIDAGRSVPEIPAAPAKLELGHDRQTGTYQAMIHPLVPYALRGFIWYQGEANRGDGLLYTAKMRGLIDGWRKQFRQPDAPFLYAQLAPFTYQGPKENDTKLAEIWWAQQEVLNIPRTGMAVTNDVGNLKDIHPRNKSTVGVRLAKWALADSYGREDIVKSGPLYAGFEVLPDGLIVRFEHSGGGLATRDGKAPTWFECAAADGEYHPALAEIMPDGKSIRLSSPKVPKPVRARFAWSQLAQPNLMNQEGLPAGAFLTHPAEIGAQ